MRSKSGWTGRRSRRFPRRSCRADDGVGVATTDTIRSYQRSAAAAIRIHRSEIVAHHFTPPTCSELHPRALSTSRNVEDHVVGVTLPRLTSRVRIPSPVTCTSTLSALQKHTSTVPRRRDGTRRRARGRVRCERPRAPHAVRLRDRGEPIVCSAHEAFFQLAIAILVVTGER